MNIYTPFNIGDKVTCCVYGDGIIIDKQRHNGRDCWFDGDSWLQIFMPNYPYGKIYFDISGRCAEEGDWLVNSPTLFYKKQHPIINTCSENRPFYLGEQVIDIMWGLGTIISVDWSNYRALRVSFDDYPYRDRDGYPQSLLYRPNGTRFSSDKQRLFHEDQAPFIVTS
ncbi:hypothetical protein ACB268_19505 [Aeromonas sanarellii]